MKLTGWLLLIGFAAGTACLDPSMPRIPPDDEDEPDKDGDQTGFDVRPAAPFYLV